jgi:D-alanyl-lipoteichoic acid acyltransferase DltB (MBOAT superfamily)
MPDELQVTTSRKQVAIRLLYTLLYVAIFELVKTIVLLITLFEYFFLLVTLRHNEPARTFANKVATYGYRVMRYLTLNENQRPFPFSDFPAEIELPDEEVSFD